MWCAFQTSFERKEDKGKQRNVPRVRGRGPTARRRTSPSGAVCARSRRASGTAPVIDREPCCQLCWRGHDNAVTFKIRLFTKSVCSRSQLRIRQGQWWCRT